MIQKDTTRLCISTHFNEQPCGLGQAIGKGQTVLDFLLEVKSASHTPSYCFNASHLGDTAAGSLQSLLSPRPAYHLPHALQNHQRLT